MVGTNSFGALESADEILDNLVPFTISVHVKEFAVERMEFLMGCLSWQANRAGVATAGKNV